MHTVISSPAAVIPSIYLAGFVIARKLRIECDPFFGDASMPDISASTPYSRQHRRLLRAPAAAFEPGEKEPRSKVAWQKPPRDHKVPAR
jgi:hypothetical protein